MSNRYAIVDIETTGGKATRDKITEIAIVLFDGTEIIDRWETLINPECYIPYGITQLTGITQEMVEDAPKFYEVAKTIVEKTENAIFVAHNVRFDYSFIREEFRRLGYTFTRKQLCTVRLTKKSFPGLRSYGLDNLIRHFNIQVTQRHRAMGDVLATIEVLKNVLAKELGETQVKELVNLGIKESLLPHNISLERLHELPEECGVYYFHDEAGQLAYVGKSKNIKKRVAEHFSKITEKAKKLQRVVYDISFEITGSELVALLYESHEIKAHRPYINRAQRNRYFPFVLHTYFDDEGYRCFGIAKPTAAERKKLNIIAEYPKLSNAKSHLNRAVRNFELCGKLCNIENSPNGKVCFQYHLKQCQGACGGLESPEAYNERTDLALQYLKNIFERDFVVIDEGRHKSEKAVVLVEKGEYVGFGYVDVENGITDPYQLKEVVSNSFESNPEVKRIIRRFVYEKKSVQVKYLKKQ